MANSNSIQPLPHELPSSYADRLGIEYTSSVSQEHKKENGQFFTPVEIASLMASYAEVTGDSLRILDPGCGSAVLSCALVEHLINSNPNLTNIELIAYEIDKELVPLSERSLSYLKQWAAGKSISLQYTLHTSEFIKDTAASLNANGNLFSRPIEPFDIIISNPPYFKLPIDDERVKAAKVIVNGHPNIYSIFMAISAKLLKENGELIFITPRSYASGGYFKTFREYFFNLIQLEKVHLFVSRKDTFSRDKVLQETVIIKGIRTKEIDPNAQVVISSSSGLSDIDNPSLSIFPQQEIIDLNSNGKILYLPTTDFEEAVLSIFKSWSGSLNEYDIQISTGPVVAFRSWDYIRDNFEPARPLGGNGTVRLTPLFWLHNVKQMVLEWPIEKPNKGQYIKVQDESMSILIPNKNYVLLRRFSSKDDKNRLVAAPYFCNFIEGDYIGVENKVNYIYRPKGHLERNEVVGICALLNSTLFDTYFRIFNGNVNVSATELREMPLPPLETIKEIGNNIILSNDFAVENTNRIVSEYFEPVAITHE